MTTERPSPLRRWLLAPLVASALVLLGAPPVAAQGNGLGGGDDNEATAINTEDGSTVFDFALTVRRVADGVVDQTNTAQAQASCTDCRTVAVAFQVVLVTSDADVVVPENEAVAVNSECAECFTYAAATQIVVGAEDAQLTPKGQRRLVELQKRMRQLEEDADEMSEAELLAAVQEAEAEFVDIYETELVPREELGQRPTDDAVTSTTVSDGTTSSTAADPEEPAPTSSTSSTSPSSTTTETTAPAPTTSAA